MTRTRWDADEYRAHADFVPKLADHALQQLDPKPGESILDVGCGDGSLSTRIAESGCQLLCIDASPSMVQSAKDKGLDAHEIVAHRMPFASQFDAVFSNAALHWMTQPDAVLSSIHRALKPGGRFIAEFGGHGNIDDLVIAMQAVFDEHPEWGGFHNPWYFPTAEAYQKRLETTGFIVDQCACRQRPTLIEGSIQNWLRVFCQGICAGLSDRQRDTFYAETEHKLAHLIDPNDGTLVLSYVRLNVIARKPPTVVP